jgi:hypothetical protein
MTSPFNRMEVDMSQSTLRVQEIIEKFDKPEFFDWSIKRQSDYIESILIGIPLNPIYVDLSFEEKKYIFEGKERYAALQNFIQHQEFALTGLKYYSEFEGMKFSELPGFLQRKIEEREITVYFINPGVPRKIASELMERIRYIYSD